MQVNIEILKTYVFTIVVLLRVQMLRTKDFANVGIAFNVLKIITINAIGKTLPVNFCEYVCVCFVRSESFNR